MKEINLLQEIKRQEKTKIDAIKKEYGPIIDKIKLLESLSKVKIKSSSFFIRANKLTCWNSLAYCCDIKKPCVWRDGCINLLGLTNNDFRKLKLKFTKDAYNQFKHSIGH